MDMNFTKAHHFSINGGNFGTINGGVNNYTLTPGSLASPATLGLNSTATGLLAPPPSQGNNVCGGSIHSVPSTPATSHPNLSPASSANSTPSPTSTTSTLSSGSDYDFYSRRPSTTPATDIEEHRYPGTSPFRRQTAQQPDLHQLTPLTDTLGLRRFTPGSQSATLSPYQTPQQDTAEFPGSPQSTGQVPTPPPPPHLSRNTQSYNQFSPLSFTPQPPHPPQNTQFLDHNSPSPLTPNPVGFPVYRAPSASPNGSDTGSRTGPSPPIPPYPQNSPPSFDSSPLSPRTVNMPQGAVDPDDPSVIFQRLRADTKGYASPLSHPNAFEYTPSPSPSARRNLPREAEVPRVDQAPELAAPQSSQHWAPNAISDWNNHVSQGDSGSRPVYDYQNQPAQQHQGSRPLPPPPGRQPQVSVHSFPFSQQPQHYPNHAEYHAPPFRQPHYQDNQPWPIFAPAMHPPHPFPPQHYPTHPNRLQYYQPQQSYHPEMNYGNAPSFPMALMH